jgi:hypothetical protein
MIDPVLPILLRNGKKEWDEVFGEYGRVAWFLRGDGTDRGRHEFSIEL